MAQRNSAQGGSTPLHMQELDDNVAILPQSAVIEPSDSSNLSENFQDAAFIDVPSDINDSDPRIGVCTVCYSKSG